MHIKYALIPEICTNMQKKYFKTFMFQIISRGKQLQLNFLIKNQIVFLYGDGLLSLSNLFVEQNAEKNSDISECKYFDFTLFKKRFLIDEIFLENSVDEYALE